MDFFVGLVAIGVIAWLVLRSRGKGSVSGGPNQPTARRRLQNLAQHDLPGTPTPVSTRGRVSVVGESHYQPAISAVVAGRDVPSGGRWDEALEAQAALVPEPNNQYDSNAVRVDLALATGWVTVGYLARELARGYQPVLRTMTEGGLLPVAPARVCRSSGGPLAVYLHLSEPGDLVFRNAPPSSAGVLPARNSAALSGEARHQNSLEGYRPPSGSSTRVWATLHPSQIQSGKHAGMPTLEVRIDGSRVGELTAAQAERYGSALAEPVMACEAEIYEGSKNLEVRVFLPAM
jgi:hypothetical protein